MFGQEIESPSGGVPGETFPRRTCAAMYRGKIPGVNISSSEHLVLFTRHCIYPRGFILKDSKKELKKKISAVYGHQSIQA